MNHILNRYLPFLMKSPLFLSILDTFWTIFRHFSYSTSIKESLTIELNYLLNWISRIFFELNNILNWILGKAILNRILMNHFLAKFKHWIESDRVSNTSIAWWRFAFCNVFNSRFKAVFFGSAKHLWDDKASRFSRVLSVKVVFAQCHNGVSVCSLQSWLEPVWPKLACSWFQV